MYQSLVIEASVIYHFFQKIGIIGKGKDPVLGVSSSIYRLQASNQNNKQEKFGKYALQIFENLTQEQYELKASQLSKAMTLHITPFTTRIIMLGRDQLHPTQLNLHVVYEYENVSDQCLWKNTEPYDLQNAKQLLQLFCQNYLLQARFTNEFLDISPQNIFTTQDGQYIITNFALNYAGTKFHRNYIPSTDPLNKEKKASSTSILYSFAFKAGLITFCQMTQIDSKDLFFEDGQFKEQLLENILALLHEKPIQKDKRFIQTIPQLFDNLTFTKEQDILEQKRNCKEKQFTYKKSEKILKHKYPKEFLDIIRKLLSVNNIQSRAIFPLLVSEDNILQVPNPYFEQQEDKFNFVQGLGENEENLECGLISKSVNENNSQIINQVVYCREIQNKITTKDNQTIITLFGLQNNQEWKYYENSMLYFSEQLMAPIHLIQKSKRETIFLFEGESQQGYLLKGKSYQNDYSIFEGEFKNNLPFKGKLTYQNKDNFEGVMDGFNKKKGIFYSQGKEFDGEFVNDQFVKGLISYDDGGIFFGNVKNGEKFGAGIYKYPHSDIEYHGLYSNDLRHGLGTFFDKSIEGMQQDVQYNYGECQTKLNEHFVKTIKEINSKIKQQKQQQQNQKQQQENEGEIEKNSDGEFVEVVQD